MPGTSTIETQYAVAPGTALAQRRHGGEGITIVNGGRRRYRRGRLRDLPQLGEPTGPRAAGVDHRGQQQVGHLDAVRTRCRAPSTSPGAASRSGFGGTSIDGNDPRNELEGAVRNHGLRAARSVSRSCSKPSRRGFNGHSSSSGGARVDRRARLPDRPSVAKLDRRPAS